MISTRLFKACIFTRVALTNKNTKHVSPTLPLKWGRMVLYRLACTIRLSSKDWKSDLTSYIYPFSRFKIWLGESTSWCFLQTKWGSTRDFFRAGNHFGNPFVQWVGEVSPPFRSGTWYLARSGLDEFYITPKRWFPMDMLCSVIFYGYPCWWQLHKLIPFMSLIKWYKMRMLRYCILHFVDWPFPWFSKH